MNKVVFAFGRMNPPTAGHSKLIDAVTAVARKERAVPVIIVSHSHDAKKNPLTAQQKIAYLKKVHPGVRFIASDRQAPSFMAHLVKFSRSGIKEITMVAGSDRVPEFTALANKYNGKDYNFDKIKVVSAGERDPDAEGVTGISGTKMREFAAKNDFKSFKAGLNTRASVPAAKKLFNDVRHGMNLKEGRRVNTFMRFVNDTNTREFSTD